MARLSSEALQALTNPESSAHIVPSITEGVPRHQRDRIEKLMSTLNDFDEVAKIMGISAEEVERCYSEIKIAWNKRRQLNRLDRIDEELAYLERIRAMALDHYERSQQRSVESHRERIIEPPEVVNLFGMDGEQHQMPVNRGPKVISKVARKTKGRDGELAALKLAMEAGKEIRALFGLDPTEVKRLEIDITTTTDAGQLAKLDAAELAELHRRAIEQSLVAQ